MKENSRIKWIDNAKALAIITVVMVHLGFGNFANAIMNTFNMPLFFFLSGIFLLHHIQDKTIGSFTRKRIKQVVVPYIIYSLVIIAFYQMLKMYTKALPAELKYFSWSKSILNIFLCQMDKSLLISYLWFFPCLFVSNLMIWSSYKYLKTSSKVFLSLVPLILLSLIRNYYIQNPLPLKLDVSIICAIFVFLGTIYKDKYVNKYSIIFCSFLYIVSFGLSYHFMNHKRIEFYDAVYGNYLLFFTTTISSIILIIFMCMRIHSNILSYIGKRTLAIYCLHYIPLFVVRHYINLYLLNSQYIYLYKLISVIIIIGSVLVIEPLVKKYLPWTIGASRQK